MRAFHGACHGFFGGMSTVPLGSSFANWSSSFSSFLSRFISSLRFVIVSA